MAKKYLDYEEEPIQSVDGLVNSIISLRDDPNYDSICFLIIEGATDKRFYQEFVDPQSCKIIIASGKERALEIAVLLEKEGVSGALVLVDRDFDEILGKLLNSPNVFYTDFHDAEMMVVASPAFGKVMRGFGSPKKIKDFEDKRKTDVLSALMEAALFIGYLRLVSLQENLSLDFQDLKPEKFIEKDDLTIDIHKMIRNVQSRTSSGSQKPKLTDQEIYDKIQQLKSETHDPFQICCGHDLVMILSLGLRKVLGTITIEADLLETCLWLAYEHAHFIQTQLYMVMQSWQQNCSFFILKIGNMN